MKRKSFSILLLALLFQSCASYKYAHQLKMVSFDDDLTKGKSAGPIKGQDCTWTVFGTRLGGDPTVDKAFMNAMNQAGFVESAGIKTDSGRGQKLRYINNVSTENEGFNALGIVAKECLTVNGMGYL